MGLITRIGDKAGALGTVVSAMGCAGCFPALGSLGVALGLGFLSQYEELVITWLLPLFAVVALLANGLGWFSHRQWHRSVLGMVGPAVVLAALYPLFGYGWTEWLLYTGLAIMVAVSVWDLLSPAHRRCAPDLSAQPRRQ